jgi:outer membrane protein OmpA-like peptidoglycan-associated protein
MLDDVVTFINCIPEKLIISIEGHTDDIGNEQYNHLLSKIRAKNVRDYLSGKITAAHRLSYSGYGDSRPVSNDTTADGKRKNRRVEIVIRPY